MPKTAKMDQDAPTVNVPGWSVVLTKAGSKRVVQMSGCGHEFGAHKLAREIRRKLDEKLYRVWVYDPHKNMAMEIKGKKARTL